MSRSFLATFIIISAATSSAHAVILYQNPHRNLRAPTGGFANSGWQWEGEVGAFPATVISKKFIITASHVGTSVNDTFTFDGVNHRIVSAWDDPDTDLRIFQVTGTMSTWAPLYRGGSEVNNAAMIYGQGTPRGDPIFVNRQAKGWMWGPGDARMSWGRNSISSISNGGDGIGNLLTMTFDEHGPAYEATLSEGDSGGGVFIKTSSGWQLAGVNYGLDSNFSYAKNGPAFRAAIFDRGGLYDNGTTLISDTAANQPQSIYSTRISSEQSWIDQVLSGQIAPTPLATPLAASIDLAPEPASGMITFAGIAILGQSRRCRRRRRGA